MTDDRRPPHPRDAETELIPGMGTEAPAERTLEIPAVDSAPRPPAAEPEPFWVSRPPVATPPPPPVIARNDPPARPHPPAGRRFDARTTVTVALAVLAAAVVLLAVITVIDRSGGDGPVSGARSRASAAGETPLTPVAIESFDPSGGSGFRERDGGWKTQTYRTAQFGMLKEGVGLRIDLGEPRGVSAVEVRTGPGPLALELRAADEPAAELGGYQRVGEQVTTTSDRTALPVGSNRQHRYWLVWVSRLAPSPGGYSAVIEDVVVTGG